MSLQFKLTRKQKQCKSFGKTVSLRPEGSNSWEALWTFTSIACVEAKLGLLEGDFDDQALTVGVGTVMDAKEVLVLITGANKAFALYKVLSNG